MSTGKWREPGVPHKGWTCVEIDVASNGLELCEMCEMTEIRYVHTMVHPDYGTPLRVGCVCAGHMGEDREGARRREADYKRSARWANRKWRKSRTGNDYVNIGGFNVVVYRCGGGWGGRIVCVATGRRKISKRPYETAEAAKLASFRVMLTMQKRD